LTAFPAPFVGWHPLPAHNWAWFYCLGFIGLVFCWQEVWLTASDGSCVQKP